MFRKILVGTDFSKASRAALAAAIRLAEQGSARVEVLHVCTLNEYAYVGAPLVVPTSSLQAELEGRLEDFFPNKLFPNSNRHVILGFSIAEEIQKFARKNGFDLIVLGSHGKGSVGRFLLGSITQKVTRDSEIPVMVVRDVEHSKEKYQGFSRILTPTDFSETSDMAAKLGIEFANFLKADFHYIHVVDMATVTDLAGLYPFLSMTIPAKEVDVNLTLQKDLAEEYFVGNQKIATLGGDPVREILKYSEDHDIDFIVMGTHGRKGMDRFLLGSVAAGVVARSKVPVITVSTGRKAPRNLELPVLSQQQECNQGS